jgi:hypothetical protein
MYVHVYVHAIPAVRGDCCHFEGSEVVHKACVVRSFFCLLVPLTSTITVTITVIITLAFTVTEEHIPRRQSGGGGRDSGGGGDGSANVGANGISCFFC